MASSAAAISSTSTVSLPSSLAFLVSNFHALVNIKLDSGNYLLWRTQVMNALRANGYIEFLDSSKPSPEPTILNSLNSRVPNPEFSLWTLVDNQLLSCLTSTLSPSTLPHVLGITHVCQVWNVLENRFNSLSKSHIHELKNKLYNVKMKGSMDDYIDEIRGYDKKLEAIGYHVDDDDLVFYALKGLPEEYRPIKSALNAKGDILFCDLATILKNEETQIHRDEDISAPKVFLANQKPAINMMPTPSNLHEGSSSTSQMIPNGIPHFYSAPMFQNPHESGLFLPTQPNRNFSKGGRGPTFGQTNKVECQICGKTNHTAMYCYHRQNLQYQPTFSYQNFRPKRGMNQAWNGFPNSVGQLWHGSPTNTGPSSSNFSYASSLPSYNMSMQRYHSNSSGYSGHSGQHSGNSGVSVSSPQANMVCFPTLQGQLVPPSSLPYQMQGGSGFSNGYSPSSQVFVATAPNMNSGLSAHGTTGNSGNDNNSPSWLFDSGASTHVTNNLGHLSHHQTCYTGDGVMVGNGSTLPVNYSGQTNSPSSSQGTMLGGSVSHPDLL